MFFSRKNYSVSIVDKNIQLSVKSGTNIYKLLIEENIIQPALCDGAGQCGKCKIKFIGSKYPKANNKEMLILAKINIDSGYRLACQQTVKDNITIDISELTPSAFIPDINTKNTSIINEYQEVINQNLQENEETLVLVENGSIEIKEEKKLLYDDSDTVSINDFKPMVDTSNSMEGPSDGVLLIQQRNDTIRYYCYSAALDNIVSEGSVENQEPLRDIIDNFQLSDFLYNVLKIRDVERVMVLIEGDNYYNAEVLIDMFRYMRFDIGMQQCEMIMPRGSKNYDITHFFRLLNVDKDNKLIFSLDMLSRTHYSTPKLFTDMVFPFLMNDNLTAVKPRGINPIVSLNSDINPDYTIANEEEVDGITLSAMFQLIKLLLHHGIINNRYQLKTRQELSQQNVSLSLSVRIYGQEKPEGFYIFRNRFSELVITQEELNEIYQIRSYIRTVIDYTREHIGVVEGLIFYTSKTHDDLINLMIDLEFIPKKYANKITYRPGEATVQAVKLFKEKDVPAFINKHFKNVKRIELIDEEVFRKASSVHNLEV